MTKKKKSKLSNAIEVIVTILCIALIVFNWLSIGKFKMTVTSWASFSLITSIGCIVMIIFLFIVSKKTAKIKTVAHRLPRSIVAGIVLYVILFLFIPYQINTWVQFDSNFVPLEEWSYEEKSYTINENDATRRQTTYTNNICFEYNGIEFSTFCEDQSYQNPNLKVKSGLLGWEYIQEVFEPWNKEAWDRKYNNN